MWVLTATQWFQDLPWTRHSSCSFIYVLQPAAQHLLIPTCWLICEVDGGGNTCRRQRWGSPLTAGFGPRARELQSDTARLSCPDSDFQSGGVRLSSAQLWMCCCRVVLRLESRKWREGGSFPCRPWGPARTCWLLIAVSGSFRLPGAPLMTWCTIHPLPVPASQVKAVIYANIQL